MAQARDVQALVGEVLFAPNSSACAQVDVADFSGPDFEHVDNRYAALTLVQQGLCDAALFTPSGARPLAKPRACPHTCLLAYCGATLEPMPGADGTECLAWVQE